MTGREKSCDCLGYELKMVTMKNSPRLRLLTIVALVLLVTSMHYLTTTHRHEYHDIYRRLYYIPIVLGGMWFALRGGLLTSMTVSILYIPHVLIQWSHHPQIRLEQYLEILLYNLIGLLTGYLTSKKNEQRDRYQRTAEQLRESYSELKNKADQILEIEEQLRRADRLSALGELSAGMAHEIRNPLGSIRGTAEIIQEGMDPTDRRYEFSRIMIQEVDRLNRVVQDFLDFARPAPIDRDRVDINAALADILVLVRQKATASGTVITFPFEGRLYVPGKEEHLKQAFLNLTLNALQAMPEGGRLDILTNRSGAEVEIRFSDTGSGIPQENLDKIFNPFFTTREKGTGLGLAISARIIQGHGGRISVDSQPGKGTTFTLYLPAMDGQE
ncbi:sensor histidine kinase [Desulfuromonas sp. AOP6]|nr:sensor histidine kinase [Desulfuromonas sp. AOP6]